MRTYFCFLIPRADVSAYLEKRCALLLFFFSFLSMGSIYAQPVKCIGGLDSIQQVSISLDCNRDVNVMWDAHPGMCYTFSIPDVMTLNNVSSGLVTFSGSGTGIATGVRFYVNESCSDDIAVNGCSDHSSTSTSVDIYSGVLPDLGTVGTYQFSASDVGGNTTRDGLDFIMPPTDLPNILTDSELNVVTSSSIRPSGSSTSDARYCIEANFIRGSLDSVLFYGTNISGVVSSGDVSSLSSYEYCIRDVTAGTHIDHVVAVSGKCRDTLAHTTIIREGSDIPSLACHGVINISTTGSGTIVTPQMMLPGQVLDHRIVMVSGKPDNIVRCADAGQRFEVTVVDTLYNQKCWGYLDVSYKADLNVNALDTTIYCLDDISRLTSSNLLVLNNGDCVAEDDIGISFSDQVIGGDCYSGDTLKLVRRNWVVHDHRGRIINASSNILVKKVPFDTLIFPQDTTIYCPDTTILARNTSGLNLHLDTLLNACKMQIAFSDRDIPTGCSGMRKIERTWLAVDWCSNDDTTHVQIITILDSIPPVFTCPEGDALGRTEIVTTLDTCGTYFRVPTFVATDVCSDDDLIIYQVKVNGILTQGADSVFVPVGQNIIEYSAEDDCGNKSSCMDTIVVKDRTQPRMSGPSMIQIAQTGITNTLVPIHLIVGAYNISDACALDSVKVRRLSYNCGVAADTLFGESINICCEDGSGPIMIELWAKDTAGNVNTMMSSIDVKVSLDCPATPPLVDPNENEVKKLIIGSIEDPFTQGLGGMTASLLSETGLMETNETDIEGNFSFENENEDFDKNTLSLAGYGSDMQGISAIDLFMIQRHILGLTPIENEYVKLAADIDQSGSISVKDIIILQNAILGLAKENISTWNFIPSNQVANNIVYTSSDFIPVAEDLKFTAYKIGDINGDIYDQAKGRNRSLSKLWIEDKISNKEERISIPISIEATEGIVAFEIDLELRDIKEVIFKPSLLKDVTIEWAYTQNGIKVVGYGIVDAVDRVEIGQLHFSSTIHASTKDVISLAKSSSSMYNADQSKSGLYLDWYNSQGTDYELEIFELYPNPATDNVYIQIHGELNKVETFTITDITGRLVMDLSDQIQNNFKIPTTMFPASGSYLVTMKSEEGLTNDILLINKE